MRPGRAIGAGRAVLGGDGEGDAGRKRRKQRRGQLEDPGMGEGLADGAARFVVMARRPLTAVERRIRVAPVAACGHRSRVGRGGGMGCLGDAAAGDEERNEERQPAVGRARRSGSPGVHRPAGYGRQRAPASAPASRSARGRLLA